MLIAHRFSYINISVRDMLSVVVFTLHRQKVYIEFSIVCFIVSYYVLFLIKIANAGVNEPKSYFAGKFIASSSRLLTGNSNNSYITVEIIYSRRRLLYEGGFLMTSDVGYS